MRPNSGGRAAEARRSLCVAICLGLITVVGPACPRPGGAGDTKRSGTRLDLAKDYLGRGQLEASEGEARKALEFDADNVEAYNVLGLVEFLRAARNFNLLEVDDCLTGVDAEALRLEMDEDLARADKQFARAVEIDPEYGEAWANRGLVAFHLDDYPTSARYLLEALSHPQRLVNIGLARAHLGWAYFHEKDMARAAKELRQAEQFNRGMCVAKYRLGRVYFARKEWNKALEQFQAISADLSCPMQEAQLYLLETYRALGASDPLAGVQKRCIEMAPKSCVAARCRALR
ncbi:MAG TPA: tetratricopeptide repeat protein [Kofleriaceae bacterium]|nr:tetratricopeptide repeat protein [Kofleriaceae bacterium]